MISSIVLLTGFSAFAAEIWMLFTLIYPGKEIEGDTQYGSIEQDDPGVRYIGDGYGILEFDGSSWRGIYNPNLSFDRSLSKNANNRIYAGSSSMRKDPVIIGLPHRK